MAFGLDIECIPDLSMVDLLPEVSIDSRLKDEAKKKENYEIKKAQQIENMALNPLFAKVICICLYNPEKQFTLMGDERDIISHFWSIVGNHETLYTYNGNEYDLNVILKRGLLYGNGYFAVDRLLCDKYKAGRHVDIMQKFSLNGKYEKLDTLAKVYLKKQKLDIDFKEFPELLKTEDGRNRIGKYCLQDAQLVYELAEFLGYQD